MLETALSTRKQSYYFFEELHLEKNHCGDYPAFARRAFYPPTPTALPIIGKKMVLKLIEKQALPSRECHTQGETSAYTCLH